MMAPRNISDCRGFTLVELLVALTIMAVVLGLLTNSMQFSLKTTDAVESSIASAASLHQGQRALKRQLQMAVPVRKAGSDDEDTLEFAAASKELEFVAPLPGLTTGGGLYRITIRVEDDVRLGGGDGRLLMTYRSFVEESEFSRNVEESPELVLLQGFSDAEFSYLDTHQARATDWTTDWRHADRLPDLVRLRVDFSDNLDDDFLDLIVAIKTTSPTGYGAS